MGWFQQLCRNTGRMIHGITQPIKDDAAQRRTAQVVRHDVEEQALDEHITLRRTTIEEIEIKPSPGTPGPHTPNPD